MEYGLPVASAKLTRTDQATLGPDGVLPSPPRTAALCPGSTGNLSTKSATQTPRHPAAPGTTTSRPMLPPIQLRSGDKTAPPQKCPILSCSRVDTICQENEARKHRTEEGTAGGSVPPKGTSAPLGSASNPSSRKPQVAPPVDVEMADRSPSDEELDPLPPKLGKRQAPGTPPGVEGDEEGNSNGDEEGDGNSDNTNENGEGNDANEDGDDDEPPKSHKRHKDKLLGAFGPTISPLVKYVVACVKLEMAVTCSYPEHVRPPGNPDQFLIEFWDAAHKKLRPGKPHFLLQDTHSGAVQFLLALVTLVRGQLSPIWNIVKAAAEPLVGALFGLDWGDPNHTIKAGDLTKDEKWLSPNLVNDAEIFKHEIIHRTIFLSFFRSNKGIGSKNLGRFTPLVPLETIAYVCAVIRHLIVAFMVSDEKANHLDASGDAEYFRIYMGMLEDIGDRDEAVLKNIRSMITLKY
ncbi:hypothetical protein FRC10_011810, partial [Ceratobasidium sp. 414]